MPQKYGVISWLPRRMPRTTERATASALTALCSGHFGPPLLSSTWSKNSVSVVPGQTTSTSMPRPGGCPANSARIDSLKPCTANLLAAYSLLCGTPRRPRIELMLTMIGCRPCFNSGSAMRVISTRAKKLTSITRRTRSGSAAANGPMAPTPALFTKISRPPKWDTAASMPRARTAASVTSPATQTAVPPEVSISCASDCKRSSRRAMQTTLPPCRASSRAIARPMPLEAPVTIARLPWMSRLMDAHYGFRAGG